MVANNQTVCRHSTLYQMRLARSSTLLDGLLAFWKMDNLSDSSPNAHTLNDHNTVSFANDGIVGKCATYVRASSEYLDGGDHDDFDFSGDRTVTGWVYLASAPASSLMGFTTKGNAGGPGGEWGVQYLQSLNKVRFQGRNSSDAGSSWAIDHPTTLSLATWYFFAATYNHSTRGVSLNLNNGTPATATGSTVARVSTNTLNLGYWDGAAGYLDGRLDAVGIWNRVLSADELTELYNVGAGVEYPF